MGGVIDQIAQFAVPIALTLAGQPELAAASSGIFTGIKTGNPVAGLLSAGGSYFGGQLGSSVGSSINSGPLSLTPANALGKIFGGEAIGSLAPIGSFVGNALGSSTIGSIAGGAIGGSLGDNLGTQLGQQLNPMNTGGGQGPPGFSPSRAAQMATPQGLSQFSSLDPFQQATNIASKGVYGGGQGNDENQYFLNLINRQLVDPNGNVQNQSSLNPVESSYLSQLGLGGYNNSTDLLKGISQYQG